MKPRDQQTRILEAAARHLNQIMGKKPTVGLDRVWVVQDGVRVVHQIVSVIEQGDMLNLKCGLVAQVPGPHTRRQLYHFATRTSLPLTCFFCAGTEGDEQAAL